MTVRHFPPLADGAASDRSDLGRGEWYDDRLGASANILSCYVVLNISLPIFTCITLGIFVVAIPTRSSRNIEYGSPLTVGRGSGARLHRIRVGGVFPQRGETTASHEMGREANRINNQQLWVHAPHGGASGGCTCTWHTRGRRRVVHNNKQNGSGNAGDENEADGMQIHPLRGVQVAGERKRYTSATGVWCYSITHFDLYV